MSRWVALGDTADGWRGFSMDGSQTVAEAWGSDAEDVLGQLDAGDQRIVRIGERRDTPIPAPVLPETGVIVSALSQTAPLDHMTGWARVALAGFLGGRYDWDGVVCLAGPDVSTWVQVSADEVVSFASFLTGRLIGALSGSGMASDEAMGTVLSRPERLANMVRQAELAGDGSMTTGALIGAELAAARPYWLGQAIGVIADNDLHAGALRLQGIVPEVEATDAMLHAGLGVLARRFGLADLE